MPKNHPSHNWKRLSQSAFKVDISPFGWTGTDIEEDYGIDQRIEVVGDGTDHAPGLVFHVQHKSKGGSSEQAMRSVSVSVEHLRYWDRNVLPVLISLYFVDTKERFVKWAHRVPINEIPAGQKTKTIRFFEDDRWDDETPTLLQAEVEFLARLQSRRIEWPMQFGVDRDDSARAHELRHFLGQVADLVTVIRNPWRLGQPKLTFPPGGVGVDIGDSSYFFAHAKNETPHPADVLSAIGMCICRVGQPQEGLRVIWNAVAAGGSLHQQPDFALEASGHLTHAVLPRMAFDLAMRNAVLGLQEPALAYMASYVKTAHSLELDSRYEIVSDLNHIIESGQQAQGEEEHASYAKAAPVLRLLLVKATLAAGDWQSVSDGVNEICDRPLPDSVLEDAVYCHFRTGEFDAAVQTFNKIDTPSTRCREVLLAVHLFAGDHNAARTANDFIDDGPDAYWGRMLANSLSAHEAITEANEDPCDMDAWIGTYTNTAFSFADRFWMATSAALLETDFGAGWAAAIELGLDALRENDDDSLWISVVDVVKGACEAVGVIEVEIALGTLNSAPSEILELLDGLDIARPKQPTHPICSPGSQLATGR